MRPGALTRRVARAGPEPLGQHVLGHGAPNEREVLVEIVDEILIPLVEVRQP